jgi:hypothetical protein
LARRCEVPALTRTSPVTPSRPGRPGSPLSREPERVSNSCRGKRVSVSAYDKALAPVASATGQRQVAGSSRKDVRRADREVVPHYGLSIPPPWHPRRFCRTMPGKPAARHVAARQLGLRLSRTGDMPARLALLAADWVGRGFPRAGGPSCSCNSHGVGAEDVAAILALVHRSAFIRQSCRLRGKPHPSGLAAFPLLTFAPRAGSGRRWGRRLRNGQSEPPS